MKTWPLELINELNYIVEKINFKDVTPDKTKVLNFLKINPQNIKIVILGQDPYPQKNVANGWAFAVNKGEKIPASLKNIFQEIKEIQGQVYADQTLELWVKQGVLLLNTALTTKINQPNSHKKIWESVIVKVIKWLDYNFQNIDWVLWGNNAKNMGQIIKYGNKIEDVHPSPFSYRYRNKQTFKKLKYIKW